ncbi:MAG: hypothetical protein K6E64_09150 [Lachnospiraceae bacterium]|nr:hypothetical protein [Lachnospiraceae bacterium]
MGYTQHFAGMHVERCFDWNSYAYYVEEHDMYVSIISDSLLKENQKRRDKKIKQQLVKEEFPVPVLSNLLGNRIQSSRFGNGIIAMVKKDKLMIEFDDGHCKLFSYPMAFFTGTIKLA